MGTRQIRYICEAQDPYYWVDLASLAIGERAVSFHKRRVTHAGALNTSLPFAIIRQLSNSADLQRTWRDLRATIKAPGCSAACAGTTHLHGRFGSEGDR
jgi:hypothetical protein